MFFFNNISYGFDVYAVILQHQKASSINYITFLFVLLATVQCEQVLFINQFHNEWIISAHWYLQLMPFLFHIYITESPHLWTGNHFFFMFNHLYLLFGALTPVPSIRTEATSTTDTTETSTETTSALTLRFAQFDASFQCPVKPIYSLWPLMMVDSNW